MIRIKVFSIRQAMNVLVIAMITLFLIVFVSFMLISSIYVVRAEFKNKIIKETNLLAYETFSRSSLIDNILKSEISALNLIDTSDKAEEWEQESNFPTYEYSQSATNQEGITVEIRESGKEYILPTKYEIEKYENGNVRVGNTKITNYSKLNLDLKELAKPSDIKITSDNKFLIFHTHATESYTIPNNSSVVNYRTTDEKYNMISVGNVLVESLEDNKFKCEHDCGLHDYPSYNGAYKSSLNTVQQYMQKEDYNFVIDVHRDALSSNLNFRPTTEINGEKAAKLMFVIGTNASGLTHDEWMKNLKLALMIQNRANEMYPGLFRDLHLSNSRYNQHVSNGAFIIEVGATGNTLEEAQNSIIASFK